MKKSVVVIRTEQLDRLSKVGQKAIVAAEQRFARGQASNRIMGFGQGVIWTIGQVRSRAG